MLQSTEANLLLVWFLQNHGWCAQGQKCQHSHDVDLILEHERQGHLSKKQRRAKKKWKTVETLMDTVLTVGEGTNGSHTGDGDVGGTAAVDLATDGDSTQSVSVVGAESDRVSTVDKKSLGHRAGFDAFMTGCVFAWSAVVYGQSSKVAVDEGASRDVTNAEFFNRVYLGGKDFPLHVTQSCFAKPSKCHLEKWHMIKTKLNDCQ